MATIPVFIAYFGAPLAGWSGGVLLLFMKTPLLTRFSAEGLPAAAPRIMYAAAVRASGKARFGLLLANLVRDLPDLVAASVIDLRAGTLLATCHAPGKLNPAKAAAYDAEAVRQAQQALATTGLAGGEVLEEMLVTLTTQWHLLRPLSGNRYVVNVLVGRRDTNLGVARAVLRAHVAAAG